MRPECKGFWLLAVLLLLTLVVRGPQLLAEGIPAGPDAYHWRDFVEARLKWNRRTMMEAYRQIGVRDPSWDDRALEFLELCSQRWCGRPDPPSLEDLWQVAKPLTHSGCNDPLVLYFVGAVLQLRGHNAEAEPYLRRAVEGFREVGYVKGRARFAPVRLARVCEAVGRSRKKEFEKWVSLSIDWTAESAVDGSFADGEQRVFWFNIWWALERWYEDRPQELYDAVVGRPGVDPWIENMVAGWCEVKMAWQARGTGWASTVTEDGWEGFSEHLGKAREHLTKAYQLHPEFPEAPALMITVVMGGAGEPGETERLWFDRAVAGQFDYGIPYSKLLWAYRPRWGGSHRASYEFGLEYLSTKRFDTIVPEYFLKAVRDIAVDEGRSDLWQVPGVYENLCTLYDGLLAEPARSREALKWKSMHAATAWRCGRYAEARRRFEELGGDVDDGVFGSFETSLATVKAQSYAYAGPLAEEIRQAERDRRTRETGEVLTAFEALVGRATDPWTESYLRDHVAALRIERALAGDEWVDLLPREGLAGWQEVHGRWTRQADGALQSAQDNKGSLVLCKSRITGNYEIRGVIEFLSNAHSVQAGVVVGYRDGADPSWTGFRLYQPRNRASLGVKFSSKKRTADGPLRLRNDFLIQVWDSQVTVCVNREPVFVNHKMAGDPGPAIPSQVGLGAYRSGYPEATVRYHRLQIRHLTTRPPAPAPD